ncbi:zinc ABC transporter ATP-binding protein AztA [Hydrogenophaga sp. 5NK40-0174]|uniref:zinc ABC transporter ATP-binding protein AztA n=1 Tax=Hydrogenophaga sp. 5NK40-0174 TaxID=3127649 RepID=UPI003108CD4C
MPFVFSRIFSPVSTEETPNASPGPVNARTVLRAVNLTAGYGQHPAIHHVDFALKSGSLTALVGPNGAGKSTLLKVLASRLPLMGGRLESEAGGRVAYLPQLSQMDRQFPLSVRALVEQGLWRERGLLGRTSHGMRHRVEGALHTVGLEGFESRLVGALSGGQFQRALFARMLVQQADVLLLDEPFAAVDERTTAALMRAIQTWHAEGRTVVAVVHDLALVRQWFPETLILARHLVAHGTTIDVLTDANWRRAQTMLEPFDDDAPLCQEDRHPGDSVPEGLRK